MNKKKNINEGSMALFTDALRGVGSPADVESMSMDLMEGRPWHDMAEVADWIGHHAAMVLAIGGWVVAPGLRRVAVHIPGICDIHGCEARIRVPKWTKTDSPTLDRKVCTDHQLQLIRRGIVSADLPRADPPASAPSHTPAPVIHTVAPPPGIDPFWGTMPPSEGAIEQALHDYVLEVTMASLFPEGGHSTAALAIMEAFVRLGRGV